MPLFAVALGIGFGWLIAGLAGWIALTHFGIRFRVREAASPMRNSPTFFHHRENAAREVLAARVRRVAALN